MQERGHWGVLRMALLAQPELQSMQFNIRFENSGDKATQYIPLNNVKIHHQPKFATTAIQFMFHRRSYHTFHKWYTGHWLSFTSNQNDYPLQLGLKLQYLRMIFWRLEWHKLRPRLPGPLTQMYPATDSLHLVTSHVLQVPTRSQVYPNILSSLWCPYIL